MKNVKAFFVFALMCILCINVVFADGFGGGSRGGSFGSFGFGPNTTNTILSYDELCELSLYINDQIEQGLFDTQVPFSTAKSAGYKLACSVVKYNSTEYVIATTYQGTTYYFRNSSGGKYYALADVDNDAKLKPIYDLINTVGSYVDTVETKLNSIINSLTYTNRYIDEVESKLDSLITAVNNLSSALSGSGSTSTNTWYMGNPSGTITLTRGAAENMIALVNSQMAGKLLNWWWSDGLLTENRMLFYSAFIEDGYIKCSARYESGSTVVDPFVTYLCDAKRRSFKVVSDDSAAYDDTALLGYVDGLEGLIGTTNTRLTTLNTTITTKAGELVTAINNAAYDDTALLGYVDDVEGALSTLHSDLISGNGALSSINDRVYNIENILRCFLLGEVVGEDSVEFESLGDDIDLHRLLLSFRSQPGEEEPSSENYQPLDTYDGIEFSVNGTTYAVPFGREVVEGTVDVTSGTLTCKYGALVLTGSETWTTVGGKNGGETYWRRAQDKLVFEHYDYYCSSFPNAVLASTNSDVGACIQNVQNNGLYYVAVRPGEEYGVTSLSSFKAWLKEQYDAGTPVIIYGPLRTPVMYDLTSVTIPTQQGSNTVSAPGCDILARYVGGMNGWYGLYGQVQGINNTLQRIEQKIPAAFDDAALISAVEGAAYDDTDLLSYVDGLEGYVDGLEGLIGTTNTRLSTLNTTITTKAGDLVTAINDSAYDDIDLMTQLGKLDSMIDLLSINSYVVAFSRPGFENYLDLPYEVCVNIVSQLNTELSGKKITAIGSGLGDVTFKSCFIGGSCIWVYADEGPETMRLCTSDLRIIRVADPAYKSSLSSVASALSNVNTSISNGVTSIVDAINNMSVNVELTVDQVTNVTIPENNTFHEIWYVGEDENGEEQTIVDTARDSTAHMGRLLTFLYNVAFRGVLSGDFVDGLNDFYLDNMEGVEDVWGS